MRIVLATGMILVYAIVHGQQNGFAIRERKEQQQVNILFNGKLLTAYCYYDSSRKPVLFPVNTTDGIAVTRSYPFAIVPGERTDHPHHTGIWLNYESVNGLDFWNNSTAIPVEKRNHYGTIRHRAITEKIAGSTTASLAVTAAWDRPDGTTLLEEQTRFYFSVKGRSFIIDRVTTLTALDSVVVFRDVKDGLFAIRVARELEMPTKEATGFVDDKGNLTMVKRSDSSGASGMYYSSEGLSGDSVWGSQGRWVMLQGIKQGKPVTIGIIDHPGNTGYPAYWHARGYGLFAINPLGRKIFSKNNGELNLSLAPRTAVTFRYRVVIHSGHQLAATEMNEFADEFAKSKITL
ncbi:MAG: PmoA family protein [Chitinophagaceae bacterium]